MRSFRTILRRHRGNYTAEILAVIRRLEAGSTMRRCQVRFVTALMVITAAIVSAQIMWSYFPPSQLNPQAPIFPEPPAASPSPEQRELYVPKSLASSNVESTFVSTGPSLAELSMFADATSTATNGSPFLKPNVTPVPILPANRSAESSSSGTASPSDLNIFLRSRKGKVSEDLIPKFPGRMKLMADEIISYNQSICFSLMCFPVPCTIPDLVFLRNWTCRGVAGNFITLIDEVQQPYSWHEDYFSVF